MHEEIIRLENIAKSYSNRLILDHTNLVIERGRAIALMGNNGSGKSTLLKIISGLTDINAGKVSCNDGLTFHYIPEHFPKLNVSAKKYIEYMGKIEQIPMDELKPRYEKLFTDFHMDSMLDISMKCLSKGSLQKVAVIQAFLKKPDVLLLDEPLSGQDIQSQKHFIKLVNDWKSQGVAVVMSCHEMFLVNQVADIAYRIEDHHLVQVDLDHLSNMDYDILCFENSHNRKVPDKIRCESEKVEYVDEGIRILIDREKSNSILREMLEEGFQLRSMRGVDQ